VGYQIPRPMSTIPIASHPKTPTLMMVSSVTRDSFEVELVSIWTGFMVRLRN
jgi:hypothetical protein